MMESSSLFIAIVLSLAVLSSMLFKPRRLEAFGYSLSVIFLITGYEDVFFICPQFPIYVSPQDTNLNPDNTMPDAQAKDVYVDTALLLARCTRGRNATSSIADAFRQAHRDRRFDLFSQLDITSLEVPILEERKRGPTRHPNDLEDYFRSISSALNTAQKQVLTQARILFSSVRFFDQDLVILLATSGEYYRLAVLQRDHGVFQTLPSHFNIQGLIEEQATPDLGDDAEDLCGPLVASMTIKNDRLQLAKMQREQEIARQDAARNARAQARATREAALVDLKDRARQRSQFVLNAGPPPYPDGMIEKYFELSDIPDYQRYHAFFEPEPLPRESVASLAQLQNPENSRHVVFTGAIRVGSSVSDKFVGIIRDYIAEMANAERARRL